MNTTNPLDSIYEKAASLGRDVFQYVVTGTMFAIVSCAPWRSEIPWWWIREWNQFTLLLVAIVVLFSLGHALLAIGFCIRNKMIDPRDTSWDRWWNCIFVRLFFCTDHVKKFRCARERTRQAIPGYLSVGEESNGNVHLGLEMSVHVKQPALQTVFIERYNTLWHLRLGLAAAFLSAGAVNLTHAICSLCLTIYTRSPCSQEVVGLIVGLVSIGFGWQLMRQHLTTSTNFLRRVIVAFAISERENA